MVTILKRSREFFRSLRFRILIIILIVGIVPLVLLEVVLLNITENNVISTRMKNISAQFTTLSTYYSQFSSIDDDETTLSLTDDMAGMFNSRIQIIDRDFLITSDSYQINKGKICISPDVNQCFNGTNITYADKENKCIIVVQGIKNADTETIEYVMFVTSSISDIISAMSYIRLVGAAMIVIMVILIIIFSLISSYYVVSPFREIDDAIDKIGQGQSAEEIQLKGCTELETVSSSFNMMTNRINTLEQTRQEFVSNVSHELKTPITSMKVLADSLVQQDDVPVEFYKEFMEDIVSEIDRENNIITDLLTLVKMEGNLKMNMASVNVNEMLESTLKMLRPLAEKKNIDLILESYRPIYADIDETKLSMAVQNLVENAIKYNNVEGWVHVSLNADQTYFYIKVQDGGYGIPADSLEHIFDRFYRVDKARSRATGGTGLGLAITKSIIQSHNGQIKVASEEGVGTTFHMQIPLTYSAESN